MQSDSAKSRGKLQINIVENKDRAVVSLCGGIDIDSSPALRDRLLALLESPRSKAVSVELSAVNHIDSSGIATLIEALKVARAHENDLSLQGLHDGLLRLFEVTGIISLFNGSAQTTQSGPRTV